MPTFSPDVPGSSPAGAGPESFDAVVEVIRNIMRRELGFAGEVEAGHAMVRDLGLDSLGLLTLAVGLENRFRLRLDDVDAAGVETVGDLAALVVRRSSAGGRP